MERSKIYSILNKFTKNEINEFRLFLKSPYFNKSQNALKLFEILRPHYPEFTSRVLNKDILHSKIFPGSNFSSGSIDNLFTKLRKLCEEYLAISSFNTVDYEKNLNLLEQFNKRKIYTLFEHKMDYLLEKIDTNKPLNSRQFYYLYNLHFFKTNFKFNRGHIEKDKDIVKEISQCYLLLKKYSFSSKIKIFVRLLITVYYTGSVREIDKTLISLLKDIQNSIEYDFHPASNIFSAISESILNNTEFDYFGLKNELFKIQDKITTEDFDLALIMLVFYFYPLIDESDTGLVRVRFEHMKLLVERKAWNTVEGNLRERNFSIIVYSAIKAGEIDWAENFIKYYSVYVVKEQRDDSINYNMAVLNYSKAGTLKFNKEEYYKKAFEYLSNFQIRDYTNKLQLYLLRTMLYFDTGEYDGVYSECKAIEQYILYNKKQLNLQVADSYIVYEKYLMHLTNYKIDEDNNKLQKLYEKILNEKPFVNKEWLIEKITEYITVRGKK